jgi:hypothetical protein
MTSSEWCYIKRVTKDGMQETQRQYHWPSMLPWGPMEVTEWTGTSETPAFRYKVRGRRDTGSKTDCLGMGKWHRGTNHQTPMGQVCGMGRGHCRSLEKRECVETWLGVHRGEVEPHLFHHPAHQTLPSALASADPSWKKAEYSGRPEPGISWWIGTLAQTTITGKEWDIIKPDDHKKPEPIVVLRLMPLWLGWDDLARERVETKDSQIVNTFSSPWGQQRPWVPRHGNNNLAMPPTLQGGSVLEQECILALGDNTSAIGWLFKTTGVHRDSFYYDSVRMITRKVAELMLGTSHCLYSQHIRGAKNTVADMPLGEGLGVCKTCGGRPTAQTFWMCFALCHCAKKLQDHRILVRTQ